ncbi:hypothetical protein, partial [Pseudorhodoplanes sp.]|uniref:hypothetical protein n=1 Tax=Pseudorhodoplanes sp. TaxID=1934341 RepID=UPI002C5A8EF7
ILTHPQRLCATDALLPQPLLACELFAFRKARIRIVLLGRCAALRCRGSVRRGRRDGLQRWSRSRDGRWRRWSGWNCRTSRGHFSLWLARGLERWRYRAGGLCNLL